MRTPRIKEDGAGYYHVISRVVDRRRVFDRDEKERFRATMRAVEAFSACEILTWSCLDNHFHLLLSVPERQPVTDEELISRLGHLYDRQMVKTLDAYLKELRREGHHQAAERSVCLRPIDAHPPSRHRLVETTPVRSPTPSASPASMRS